MDGRLKKQRRGWLTSYLWSAPSLALIALIVVFPILYTFFISLTTMNVYHWFDFTIIGLDNYVKALFVFDSGFLSALINTVLWTVVNMAVQLILAFVLASLLNIKRLRLRKLYKTLLMFPWAMPGYVSILLWKTGMFNTEFGLLNQWMGKLGLEAQRWLASDVSAFICCTVVNLWLALPFMLMIMDGAMQSIDRSYYESAVLDGANWLQRSWSITIPSIRPIIAPAVIITIFTTFKQFDVIYLLTQDVYVTTDQAMASSSAKEVDLLVTWLFRLTQEQYNYKMAAVIGIMVFIVCAVFTVVCFRFITFSTRSFPAWKGRWR